MLNCIGFFSQNKYMLKFNIILYMFKTKVWAGDGGRKQGLGSENAYNTDFGALRTQSKGAILV